VATSDADHEHDVMLPAVGDQCGRISWRGLRDDAQAELLWLPGMFDNSDTRTVNPDDDIRAYLTENGVALAELDYPSHLDPRPAEVATIVGDKLRGGRDL